ncbi:rho GTPase-activating protein 20-like isoform X2 [Mesocricetus auratus]|nr:rho GTPase-activating protein 20-like isoform X2 [Mesocricetus auratus]XP_040607021.1 rho GTPase-activating protein 20-like isoform X2 [Mesocricetus auratus]XP_040607022.1 rho GTPase-activating protein 20-like isoform X2 [Mesocricetus auratus]XP_040607023.1 rho GTPase-activating protein 20-like isoform X2 [Mesocricetus auratus]
MEILNGKVTDAKIKNQPLMFHGAVELRRGSVSKKCHLYLYRDFLVVTNSRYKITFKIKYVIPLTSLWIGDCVDTDFVGPSQARKSIFLGWPMENFIATFRSVDQKRDWWCFLERSIKQTKEKYHGRSTALEIFTDDIPSSKTSFTITATHLDTVNDIIMKLRPLLGILNAEEDYQLWFSSSNEEAPCPLLGHENPYAIKMSELRNDAFMALGPSNYTAYLNIQKVIQDMQAPHVPGKLILKPKESPRDHQQSNAETTVRRRSLLSRIFRRGASTCHDCACSRAPAPSPGRLFNNPLGAICQDGNLPTSILTMLSLLEETGPAIEGIFRKSGSIAECQDVKDKLDLGEEVNLREESIVVVSSVLKDFLRNIPGGVFSSSLYDKWMSVTDLDIEKERIASIQSLLEQLPTPNVVLLRQLFHVLHSIERHSSTNYMTSYNLSVCMAPSLLCLPNTSMLELGKEISKQISLVQFFIENFEKIFEGNTNIHLGQGSVMPSNGKESLDTFIGLREMDAVQDDEKTCASETRHSSGDTEPRHPPAAPHEGECSVEWSSNSDNENQG